MGSIYSKEYSISEALEKQDASELRSILKDLTSEQIRELCKSLVPNDENQYTILHLASWQDNPDLLAPFLDYADDLEVRDGFGWTPLMTAVNRGSKQNATMLLTRGARVDCDWTNGMSLIADAMNYNDIELIELLIKNGARVVPTPEMLANGEDKSSFFLLNYAVDDGLFDIAKLLIEKGKVPLNTLDLNGWSPLHLAAGHNNIELVSLLLEKGADVNVKDSHGNTPLAWAREMNSNDVMSKLLQYGATADKEWHGDKLEMKTNEERAEEEGWMTEEYDQNGEDVFDEEAKIAGQPARFEIEVEDSNAKQKASASNKDFYATDALQRQRSVQPKEVY